MAMAAVRLAARRLTGQQTQFVSGAAPNERLRTLQRKKEEIYDLLHEIQLDKSVPYTTRMFDRRLLQHLSARIDPRPRDAGWRKYSFELAINFCLPSSSVFMAYLYMSGKWSSYFYLNKQVQEAGSNSKATASCAEPNIEE